MLGKVNESMSIYQIVARARFDTSHEQRNVHHYEFPGYVPSTVQLQEVVDGLDVIYRTHLQGSFHSGLEVYGYDVRRVDLGDLPTLLFTPTAGAWVGSAAGDPLPPMVSGLVSFKAATEFPRTSRTYLFTIAEGANTAQGIVGAGTVTAMTDWGNSILDIFVTGAADAVKVAVRYGGDPRVVVASNPLTTVVANAIWASQRRRRQGVGI